MPGRLLCLMASLVTTSTRAWMLRQPLTTALSASRSLAGTKASQGLRSRDIRRLVSTTDASNAPDQKRKQQQKGKKVQKGKKGGAQASSDQITPRETDYSAWCGSAVSSQCSSLLTSSYLCMFCPHWFVHSSLFPSLHPFLPLVQVQ